MAYRLVCRERSIAALRAAAQRRLCSETRLRAQCLPPDVLYKARYSVRSRAIQRDFMRCARPNVRMGQDPSLQTFRQQAISASRTRKKHNAPTQIFSNHVLQLYHRSAIVPPKGAVRNFAKCPVKITINRHTDLYIFFCVFCAHLRQKSARQRSALTAAAAHPPVWGQPCP